jgi:hypothetical protein
MQSFAGASPETPRFYGLILAARFLAIAAAIGGALHVG